MKQILIAGFGVVCAAFILAACTDSSGDAAGVSGAGNTSFGVASTVDETAKTITMYSPSCELVDGAAVFNAVGDTAVNSYSISNDSLTLIDDKGTIIMTGNTSGSIYGTWYLDLAQLEYSTGSAYFDSLVTATFEFSENGTSFNVDMSQVCYADYVINELGDDLDGVTVTKNGCGQVTLSMDGVSITQSFYMSFGKSVMTISYNGQTCTAKNINEKVSASTCTVANLDAGLIDDGIYSYNNDDEYDACYSNLFGSEESTVLAKTIRRNTVAFDALVKASAK